MTEDVQAGVKGRVLGDMPDGVEPAAGDDAALGACSKADLCTARTLLPCLTCPSFVTDVHHLTLFEQAVADLDLMGIQVSAGAACAARTGHVSHVYRAMGLEDRDARCVIRVSPGSENTPEELEAAARSIAAVYERRTGALG